ncbi:MAG: hypothetical protein WD875_06275 [Pirellulales bacterium]
MTAHNVRTAVSRNAIASSAIAHVGAALREPEEFALAWQTDQRRYPWFVWLGLLATAVLGTTTYGMSMGLLGGVGRIIECGLLCTLAAGLAWAIPLPALYILNSMSGSRLPVGSTVLAALVTTSWGGLAMIASIPINWFFTVAIPYSPFILLVNLIVFAGVGVSMMDVFGRVMEKLEPQRGRLPVLWLLLVGAIGGELFYFFGLFEFVVAN